MTAPVYPNPCSSQGSYYCRCKRPAGHAGRHECHCQHRWDVGLEERKATS